MPKMTYIRKPNRPSPPVAPVVAPAAQVSAARQMRELDVAVPPQVSQLPAEIHPLLIPRATLAASGLSDADLLNPSICVHRGQLRAVVRVLAHAKTYNFLGTVSDAWELSAAREVKNLAPGIRNPFGYEDCRLFELDGRLHASATILDGNAAIAILEFSADGDVVSAHIQKSDRHEKNWMPVVQDGIQGAGSRLWFVYSVDPLVVLRYDTSSRLVHPTVSEIAGRGGCLRGSSQLRPYGDGFLAVVHQVHRMPTTTYLHRFVRFDRFLQVIAMSEPFYFVRRGIEFCAGLVHWRGKWVLSFGLADKDAQLALVDGSVVQGMVG